MNTKKYKGKRVCILGHKGYIGSTLKNILRANYVNVEVSDVDLSNARDIESQFSSKYYDVIFHLASADLSSIPSNMKERDIDSVVRERSVNCDSILNLHKALNAKSHMGKTKIVFTSSTNVYGDIPQQIVGENTNDNPQTLWQAHKVLSEHYINILFPNSISLRIPNIYGIIPHFYYEPITDTKEYLNKNTYFRPIINKIIRLGIENEKLTLYKNKMCFRDYLHIYDLITALLVAGVTDGERKYYTLGCDNRSTIEDVWNIIAQNLGGIPIEYDDSRKLSDMETRSFTSDYTEFRALTGWNAKYTIRYGIRETVEQIKRVLKDDSTF